MEVRNKNVIIILNEMFKQRGYTDIEEKDDKLFATKENGDNICAFYSVIEKLNVTEIHNHISILQKSEINHGIIVYDGVPTPAVKNVISNAFDIKLNIELFCCDDLQFNITKHILVPKHIKLFREESKEFKNKYGTSIPILLRSDPISRFYDYSKGDIIKIIRKNGFISYRIVR